MTQQYMTIIDREHLCTVLQILQRELAEVSIEPKEEYYLDFGTHTAKEYQKKLLATRSAVQEALEKSAKEQKSDRHAKQRAYRLVFYIISEPCSEGGEREMTIYETPYFSTKEECVHYASALSEVPKVAWELLCYSNESPIRCPKPDYLYASATDYLPVTLAIQTWLRTGLDDPNNLTAPEDQSDYYGHLKVSEPNYDTDAYVRFDEAKICLERKDP